MFPYVFCFMLKEHLLDIVVLMMYILLIMSVYALCSYSYQSRAWPEMWKQMQVGHAVATAGGILSLLLPENKLGKSLGHDTHFQMVNSIEY